MRRLWPLFLIFGVACLNPAPPLEPKLLSPGPVWATPGEMIEVEFEAPGQALKVRAGNQLIPTRTQQRKHRARFRAPARGGNLPVEVESGGARAALTELRVLDDWPVAEVSHDEATLRSGPDPAFDRYDPLLAGVRSPVTGRRGDWLRLGAGGWIEVGSVTIDEEAVFQQPCLKTASVRDNTLRLTMTGRPPLQVDEDNDRLRLRLAGAGMTMGEVALPAAGSRIQEVSLLPDADGLTIELWLADGPVSGYYAEWSGDVLLFHVKPALPRSLTGLTVVVDAGHGGIDEGAVGVGGLREKDLNLRVALATAQALEAAGARVVLTRDHDTDVAPPDAPASEELASRVRLARQHEAGLFLSIHHNAKPDIGEARRAHGTDIYYYHPQSRRLAQALATPIGEATGEPARRYLWRSFHVIRQTDMPAVLLELNYISNPDIERELLVKVGYPETAAAAIVKGCQAFLRR